MASGTAGSSAVNMLRQLLGRTGDLSAATDQRGSSSRRRTAPQTTASVESEVCSLFGVGHQARSAMADMSSMPSSTASASFPSVRAAQTGLLYTVTRNVTANFRSANYRSSWGGKRKGLTYSDVVLWSRRMIASKLQFCLNEFPCLYEMIGVFYKSLLAMADFVLNSSYPSLSV